MAQLADGAVCDAAVNALSVAVPGDFLSAHRAVIDRTFGKDSVEQILAALDAEHNDWADDTAKTIRAKSPTSLKIAFRQVREGSEARLRRLHEDGIPHGQSRHCRP